MTAKRYFPVVLFILGASVAGAKDDLSPSSLEGLDIDHDGLISQSEAKSAPNLSEQFASVDLNHDGVLSKDEIAAFQQAMRVAQHRRTGTAQ